MSELIIILWAAASIANIVSWVLGVKLAKYAVLVDWGVAIFFICIPTDNWLVFLCALLAYILSVLDATSTMATAYESA